MERLTKRVDDGKAVMDCEVCKERGYPCHLYVCRNRLKDRVADYEDTGLEPEQIRRLQGEWNAMRATMYQQFVLDDENGGANNG